MVNLNRKKTLKNDVETLRAVGWSAEGIAERLGVELKQVKVVFRTQDKALLK